MIYKVLIDCFFLFLAGHAFAQTGTIKGVVIDSHTYERLPFASAFINNTTIGASANEKGEFVLRNVPIGQHELVVTFVGHHYYQSKIIIKDTVAMAITVRLRLKELKEVTVHSKKDKNWQRQYEKFKKLFLGNSDHAVSCEILNPWVLDFETNNTGFFKASASDILRIENYSLGYRLFYQLTKFSIGSKEFTISGNVRFNAMETSDTATLNQWVKNRQEVYEGSSRHLFKSIVDRRVVEEGFDLYRDNTGSGDIIRLAGFLGNVGHEITHYAISDLPSNGSISGEYKIQFPQRLEIHYLYKSDEQRIYRNVTHPISWVEVKNDFLIINSKGIILNPYDMHLLGTMSEQRIAEFLPYDFQPLKTKKNPQPSSIAETTKPLNVLAQLLEKPYLHTDKSYYYPNETVWFRGYMNYAAPVFKESLSQVLHIDLLDKSKNVVASKIFPITNGNAQGFLTIPPIADGGDYVLRAYTRWILNFDSTLVFVKPLKVLEYAEVARAIGNYISNDSLKGLSIDVEKDSFKTRERITVKIGVKDFLENFTPTNFSISVTDFKQAVPTSNETTILNSYNIPLVSLPDSLPNKVRFPIQQGIDFKGRFVVKKGKPSQGIITAVQRNTSQVFMITTAENGYFSFSNLKLYDSSKIAVLAKTLKGKRGRVLLDSAEQYSPPTPDVEPLNIEVYKADNPSKYNTQEFLDARMLDEVVIQGTREPAKSSSVISADAIVTGDFLRSTNSNNILISLQSKVPGLRVVNGLLLLGPPTGYGAGNNEDIQPLVLIDGVVINSSVSFESIVDRISAMSAQEIERIEVYKYSSGAVYGSRGATGVISITTRTSNDYPSIDERAKFDEMKIKGFSASKKFYSPEYSNPTDNVRADYRSTIYWNPFVRTSENNQAQVSFYAADLPTQYRIVVEGITIDGRIVHGEKLITVEERP
jgi:hypothetical protein